MARISERIVQPLERDVNCYTITVILADVTKQTALAIAETIQEDIDTHHVGDVVILTSHMKDAVISKPAKRGAK